MESDTKTWPLISVFHKKDRINPTPTYQRYSVWDRYQKQLLLDSVYRGIDIPKLYLRAVKSDVSSPFEFEAVDGQQRLRTFWEFYSDQFPLHERLSPDVASKKYSELSSDVRDKFDHYQVTIVVIKQATDEDIREMFCRLQNGKPLNSAERRNAMVSNMREFCAKLADHRLFSSAQFGNSRMQFQQVVAQTVALELAGGPTDTRNTALQKLYTSQREFDTSGRAAKRIRKIYDYLADCFPERTPELKRGYVVTFYMLVSQLMNEYSIAGRESTFRDFLIDFDARRRGLQKDENEMVRFTEKLSHASDSSDSIDFRLSALRREFHSFCTDLVSLDSQRGFDQDQRLAIYRRDGGICKACGTKVLFEDFNADHVVPYVAAGPTTVQNGRLTCESCNKSKGKRILDG